MHRTARHIPIAIAVFCIAPDAHAAACSVAAPLAANAKVDVVYDPSDSSMKACVAGNWVVLAGGGGGATNLGDLSDVLLSSPALNNILAFNGTEWVNSAISLTENDPEVGALTGSKWCTANAGGTAIVCNQDAPAAGASSSGTAGYVQLSDGSGGFTTSGTTAAQQLFWDNTNKRLGIGTAGPAAKLDVLSSGYAQTWRYSATSTDPSMSVWSTNTAPAPGPRVSMLVSNAAFEIFDQDAPASRLWISDSTGNVGIGSSAPGEQLSIGNNEIVFHNGGNKAIGFQSDFTGTGWVRQNSSTWHAGIEFNPATGSIGIGSANADNANWMSGSNKVLLLANGSVGIGTTNPGSKLDVSGQIRATQLASLGWTGTDLLAVRPGDDLNPTYNAIVLGNAAWTSWPFAVRKNGNINSAPTISIDGTGTSYVMGNVGIRTSNPAVELDVYGDIMSNGTNMWRFHTPDDGRTTLYFGYGSNGVIGGWPFSFETNGALTIAGNAFKPGGGSWTASSDARLKDVDGPYEHGLGSIVQLNTVRFHYKRDNRRKEPSDRQFVGLIAQDVQKVIPEAVSEREDGYLDLDTTPINFALINAIKELKTANDQLRAEFEAYKAANP